jgi:hypothetical protein
VTLRPPGSAGDLDTLVAAVEDLATAVGAHDRRLRKVERTAVRRSPTQPRRPARRRGRAVAGSRRRMAQPDPETAAAELISWVDWLRRHYQLADRLPESWRNEPAIVAELSALRHAWLAAYGELEPSFERVYWHDALGRVLNRIGEDWYPRARRRQGMDSRPG